MFNSEVKEKAIEGCQNALERYNRTVESVQQNADKLFRLRYAAKEIIIEPVENYINALANRPKEFDKSFAELRLEYKNFNDLIADFEKHADKALVDGSVGADAGGKRTNRKR